MIPRHGEVWLVDMGMAAKTRPAFVTRAERAMRRAARNIKIQKRSLGLPVIVWLDGKVVEKPV